MSQISKVAKYLLTNARRNGLTASMIARGTGVPRTNVMKRIHDLRVNEGFDIVADRRQVNGKSKVYYRFAA
jgi:biotin operon repressor